MFVRKKDPVFGKNLLKLAHKKKRWWGYLLNEDPRFESDEDSDSSSSSYEDSWHTWGSAGESPHFDLSRSPSRYSEPITEEVPSLPDSVPPVISDEDVPWFEDEERDSSPDHSIDSKKYTEDEWKKVKRESVVKPKKKKPKLKTATKKKIPI